ncbi:MAG: hypothetical protein QF466_02000 [Desulfobacterales bacterium]|nr:hypothetical protein [Desulfobacterales bacterium]
MTNCRVKGHKGRIISEGDHFNQHDKGHYTTFIKEVQMVYVSEEAGQLRNLGCGTFGGVTPVRIL